MTEAGVPALLKRHLECAAPDQDNFTAWRKIYPAKLAFEVRRIRGAGDFWVAETSISYDGGPWQFGCSLMEFRGDRVVRETITSRRAGRRPSGARRGAARG